jgi:hypothetical protein
MYGRWVGGRGVEEEEGHFGGNNAAADNGRSEGMMMPGDGEDATCSNCLNIVARSGRSLYIYIYICEEWYWTKTKFQME